MEKKFTYLNKIKTFNDDQIVGANCFDGPLLILAGPGSGKSTVLKVRTSLMVMGQNIVKDENNKNIVVKVGNKIDPENILMVTFTNKAAGELELDMKEYLDEELGSKINIGTFHSLASRILKENYKEFGINKKLKIIQGEEQVKIIKLVNKYSESDESNIISQIGLWKNELLIGMTGYQELYGRFAKDQRNINIIKVYEKYEEYKQLNNLWDQDDLISRCILFLQDEKYKHIKEYYQEKFKYIMLDEYQDTNASQYKFSMLLKSDLNNICVVGDPDQSIYEWRGADMSIIRRFTSDFNNSKEVLLLQNYRSQGNIIEASDFILQNNNTDKKPRGSIEQGSVINRTRENIYVVNVEDDYEEARFVLKQIRKLSSSGIKLKDIAIFGRSIKHVEKIEEMINADNELVIDKTAYNISTQASFYKQKDIMFIWHLIICSINPHHNKSILVLLKLLKIDKTVRDELEKYSILNNVSIFSIIWNMDKYHNFNTDIRYEYLKIMIKNTLEYANSELISIEKIIQYIKFNYLILKDDNKDIYRYFDFFVNLENVELLAKFFNRFEKLDPEHELCITKDTFIDNQEVIQNYSIEFDVEKDYLNLMTMHASKGLEFEAVFCVGMNEGKFPSKHVISDKDAEADRRLAFVAYTRSKQKLYLVSSRTVSNFGKKEKLEVSRYVKELFEEQFKKSEDNNYQEVVDNFINKRKMGEVLTQIDYSSIVDLSWQKRLVPGDKIIHTKLGNGCVIELCGNYLHVDFSGRSLKVPINNPNLMREE